MEEGQNAFMVKFIKSLNFTNIKILTVNDNFIVFIAQRRGIIEFTEEFS